MAKTQKKSEQNLQYGSVIFGLGLLIALISAFFNLGDIAATAVIVTLIILGIIIGVLNIAENEVIVFLLASMTVVILLGPFLGLIAQYLFNSPGLTAFFSNLIALIVPAALVVALKALFTTAKKR